ncbi:ABC transporter ATP-binding protein [Martelella mediterranea]|uniref:ABC transporter ATP-binding protein n=1 Tax=Martelella mediterranea TaxID=293089 RepID=UPI001E44BC5E|nr:ABC transporter ATP-binding protein [Martelella mediterranea]MCD1635815.1 ABC transporter ATP-binding protein [Martelella mediterranea]
MSEINISVEVDRGDREPQPDFVKLERIRKHYGSVVALDDVSLDIREGEFVTLLGPSGSGKTTCLRAIAGMMTPDGGKLSIAGRDLSSVPMNRRNIGMVFQNYSLFPHLTVAQNVGYPLRVRRIGRSEAQARVERALSLVRLDTYGDRRPAELSGGQQQRIALARAVVFEPDVLLLDEPLSALDRVLREEMQLELRRIHREIGTTMVCVTHDRTEALTMSERVVVMRDGRIVQDAPPEQIYLQPESRFVAEFLGEVNIVAMTASNDGRPFQDEAGRTLALEPSSPAGSNGAVDLVVRVEHVGLKPAKEAVDDGHRWRGEIREALFLGDAVRMVVDCHPHVLVARLPIERAIGLKPGDIVDIDLAMRMPMVFAR